MKQRESVFHALVLAMVLASIDCLLHANAATRMIWLRDVKIGWELVLWFDVKIGLEDDNSPALCACNHLYQIILWSRKRGRARPEL